MAKRKITVTVDEELVDAIRTFSSDSVSAVVNAALAAETDRRARSAALDRLLTEWDTALGPVGADAEAAAVAAFDDLDGVDVHAEARVSDRNDPDAA